MVSSKTLPKDLNLKFRSKFNPAFTNYCYLHCAILKVYRVLKKQEKRFSFSLSLSLSKCSKWDFCDLENISKVHEVHQSSLLNWIKNSYVVTIIAPYYAVIIEIVYFWATSLLEVS